MNSIDLFVQTLDRKKAMIPINIDDISALESKLDLSLPDSYKYLISTYGLVHSPNVLTKTCDLTTDVSTVLDFLSLEDVFSLSNLYEMSGMPKGHILFASDAQGNMFCFKSSDCDNQQIDSPVWFFNQGTYTVNKVALSFIEWLQGVDKG